MSLPELFDTHCHLDLPPLRDDLAAVLARASAAGVTRCLVPGIIPAWWPGIAELAGTTPMVLAAYGVHPQRAGEWSEAAQTELAALAPGAAAIGEIGLDYTEAGVDRLHQQRVLRAQLQLAVAAGRPVLIHCRKAFRDLLTILREERVDRVGGVMHAFSGSPETARECIRLGLRIAVAGTVTYGNAVRPLAVAREIPLSHLVLETDAPDMTPEPLRGRENEPAFLIETAKKVAQLKGISLAEVARVTTENATRLFCR
jgi:TatD DNase family protein